MGEEGATPCGFRVAHSPGDHCRRQATHGAPGPVDETGLACEVLASGYDAHDVALRFAQSPGLHDGDLALLVVDLGEVLAQATRGRARIEVRLHHDPPGHDVQATAETEKGGDLCLAAARLGHGQTAQLVFHLSSHGHRAILP